MRHRAARSAADPVVLGSATERAPYIKSIATLNITYHIAYDLLYRLSLLASFASGTAPTHLWGARPDLKAYATAADLLSTNIERF